MWYVIPNPLSKPKSFNDWKGTKLMNPHQDQERRKKRKKIPNESSLPIKKRRGPKIRATKAVAEDAKLISPCCNADPKVNGTGNSTSDRSILQGVDMIANSDLSHSNVIADSLLKTEKVKERTKSN